MTTPPKPSTPQATTINKGKAPELIQQHPAIPKPEEEVILFFDEADSLFGKRTDIKDSHDRYANQKVEIPPKDSGK